VDVHASGHPVPAEEPGGRARLPDQALVDLGARLDLLVRIDPDAGRDQALRAEDDLVPDGHALLDASVLAPLAPAADDRPLEVRLPVLVEVSDVLPVAVADVAVDRPTHLEQEREELLREVVRPVGRHVTQDLRIEDVDASVDRVREDLAPGGLLEEPLDAPVL